MSSNLTGTSDPNQPGLAPATRALMARRDLVVNAWMDTMRRSVPKAGPLHLAILGNTLPAIVDTVAMLLTEGERDHAISDLTSLANEHGGERARLTPYDITTLIHELQLFKQVLFAQMEQSGTPLDLEQRALVANCLDNMMRDSANAFAAVQAALREQFIAAITHDLRTPLSNARMAAELIERMADDPDVRQLAQTILRSAARIDSMTCELLDRIVFGGAGKLALRIAEFDLGELAREVATAIETAQRVELDLPPQPVSGHWCRETLRRAVENLVGNAFKYGRPGAPVTLSVSSDFERARIAVHNDGDPIPPEECESIFQLYRRAARGKFGVQGWGVGLPFARKAAEAHGGSIIVASNPHDGTTFVIDIPLDARPYQGAASAA
jgi:signal transduction histidine kinase